MQGGLGFNAELSCWILCSLLEEALFVQVLVRVRPLLGKEVQEGMYSSLAYLKLAS